MENNSDNKIFNSLNKSPTHLLPELNKTLNNYLDTWKRKNKIESIIGPRKVCDNFGTVYQTITMSGIKKDGKSHIICNYNVIEEGIKLFLNSLDDYLSCYVDNAETSKKFIIWRMEPSVAFIFREYISITCRLTAYFNKEIFAEEQLDAISKERQEGL